MKTIAIVATGGTIAGTGKKGKTAAYHAGEIDIDSIIETIPEINEVAHIKEYQLMNIDSNEMTHEKWLILKNNIEEILSDDTIDGAVVTHGTDTCAYSAAALDTMLIHPKVPVVLTGSQLPAGEEDSDAAHNIYDAFLTACGAPAGVYLTFDGRVIHGLWATKIRTMGFDAFVSVNCPYAGKIVDGKLMMQETAKGKAVAAATVESAVDVRLDSKVAVFKLIPGFDPVLLETVVDLGYHGVVLEAYGCGGITNYRRNLLPAIKKMIHKGMVVAATTQSIFDGCDLSQYEVGVRALKLGVIPAGNLTTEALVVRTMIALGRWTDKKDIEAFLRGDMSPVDRSVPLKNFIE